MGRERNGNHNMKPTWIVCMVLFWGALIGCSGDDGSGPVPGANNGSDTDTENDTDNDTDSCPLSVLPPGDTIQTLEVDGLDRSYILHVPDAYTGDEPVPLILDFHGLSCSASKELSVSSYPDQVDDEGVIMAFPEGESGSMGAGWNVGPCCVDDVDDVAFVRAIVAHVESLACIDKKRVYAVGVSLGGGMSYYLGCHASDIFAAIAPAAFDLLEENVTECAPARPITVVSFRGTADMMVPYDGGYSDFVPDHPMTFLGAVATFEKWAEFNGCTDFAEDDPIGEGCQTYDGCSDGVQVTLCTEENGGHEPGDATVSWPVLKKYSLP